MQFGIPMYIMDGAGVENFLRDGIIKLSIVLKNVKNLLNNFF